MNASVIICAHTEQRWPNLVEAVRSVEDQRRSAHEIVVVIDHNPSLYERARAAFESAHVVENRAARGLGGARNSGVEQATGDIVAFIDDDAVASPEWLGRLLGGYADPSVVGVGGAIEADWEHARPAWYPREFDWTIGCSYVGMPESSHTVRNLIGCNMSYRRDAVKAAGGFRLGYGCDETEFCIRVSRLLPWSRLLYDPDARVRHHVPRSRGTLKHFMTRCYFEGGSKAVVTRLAGPASGLASERTYVRKTLPAGVRLGLRDASRGDRDGLLRAGAIVLGLGATSMGYIAGTARITGAARRRGWTGTDLSWRPGPTGTTARRVRSPPRG